MKFQKKKRTKYRSPKNRIDSCDMKKGERTKKAPLPFTTSTLQQEASKALNFPISKTMRIAQQLYEGVDIKGNGTVGVITYLRTDSTRISEEADAAARSVALPLTSTFNGMLASGTMLPFLSITSRVIYARSSPLARICFLSAVILMEAGSPLVWRMLSFTSCLLASRDTAFRTPG